VHNEPERRRHIERSKDTGKEKDYYRRERSFGSLNAAFSYPTTLRPTKSKQFSKNGVLSVTLPKSAEAQQQAKKIEMTAG
jgi:HSP20 family protein